MSPGFPESHGAFSFLYSTAGGTVIVRSSDRKTYGKCIFDPTPCIFEKKQKKL